MAAMIDRDMATRWPGVPAHRLARLGLLAVFLWAGGALPVRGQGLFAMQIYHGICEASAAAFIDETHFAVASDETNVLRIYERGAPSIGERVDLTGFTGFDKSDIEAAARIGDRIYWLSSHSLNSSGQDKAKRKIFFATKIVSKNGVTTLEPVGTPAATLREPLLAAAGVSKTDLNIEGLAATPDGQLLVGLRDTLNGKALVVPFRNPAAVLDQQSAPAFGVPIALDLGGKGIRSLDRVEERYFILAGPVSDASGFALYSWQGPGAEPVRVSDETFEELRPEALMGVPKSKFLQILSDDGADGCTDGPQPGEKNAFRSIDVEP